MNLVHRLHEQGSILLETIVPEEDRRVVWLFERPRDVLVARDAGELDRLLQEIDRADEEGFFAVGYLTYEAAYELEPALGARPTRRPLGWFGIYGAPEEVDPAILEQLASLEAAAVSGMRFEHTPASYAAAFGRVKEHIFEGDVYQINYTGRMHFTLTGSPLALYRALSRAQGHAYGALINTGERFVLSRSPELFFSRHGRHILTRPMKGTYRTGSDDTQTRSLARRLSTDPKNQAENLMIVDLLRNDLSVVCDPGTVEVPVLFDTEQHETLIQMTSTVTGRLRKGTTHSEIFRALFPCGSVTGAPKIRAMQIIRDLELSSRGVYCGAIGWIGPGSRSVFNVAIRTAEVEGVKGRLGIGSGIVWDSELEAEYEECLLKAEFFKGAVPQAIAPDVDDLGLIETMRWHDHIALLPLHLERLRSSAEALDFTFDDAAIAEAIARVEHGILERRPYKIRLQLARDGTCEVEIHAIAPDGDQPLALAIAATRRSSGDPLLRHKTTRRDLYEEAHLAAAASGADELLFLNERGELCEGTRTNLFLRRDGSLLTPPVASGLLPGVYRTYLLQSRSDVREERLTLADLLAADEIFLCNAVRGLVAARLLLDENGAILVVQDRPLHASGSDAAGVLLY